MDNPLARLWQFIVQHYDLEELRTLCFDLGVDYDELRGEGLSAKARELLLYLGRRGRFDALLDALRQPLPEPFDPAALQAATPSFEAGELQAEITELRQAMASMARLGLPLTQAQGHLTALEARVSGLGAVAQDGSVAATTGGVAVGGDVFGGVRVVNELPPQVLELFAREQLTQVKCVPLGIPDRFVTHGAIEILMRLCGLDCDSIRRKVLELLKQGDGSGI